MRENEIIKAICIDQNHDGLGVVKVDNYPIFVNNLIKDEEAKIKILKLNKSFGLGANVGFIKSSKNRVEPLCKYFNKCGGCDLMHMTYKSQLDFKLDMANATFKRIGHLDFEIKKIVGMENPYNYRNKVQIPFSNKNGKVICGFYKKKSHEVIEVDNCYLQPNKATDIARLVRNLANEYKISGYDEIARKGVLRHVIVRKTSANDYMVIIVINGRSLNNRNEIVNKLIEKYPDIKSVILNYNNKNNNVILGDKYDAIYGDDSLVETLLGLKFKLSHKAFFQINHEQTEKLYSQVLKYADVKEDDVVLDCYCGVGTMTLLLSEHSKKVYGIEIVEEAIEDAKKNSALNNINSVEFIVGKVEDEIMRFSKEKIDVVVVDPPRKGLDLKVIETLKLAKVKKIVYVSCDIATLARDLHLLEDFYKIKDVTLFDMFPITSGIETIALLERKIY